MCPLTTKTISLFIFIFFHRVSEFRSKNLVISKTLQYKKISFKRYMNRIEQLATLPIKRYANCWWIFEARQFTNECQRGEVKFRVGWCQHWSFQQCMVCFRVVDFVTIDEKWQILKGLMGIFFPGCSHVVSIYFHVAMSYWMFERTVSSEINFWLLTTTIFGLKLFFNFFAALACHSQQLVELDHQ